MKGSRLEQIAVAVSAAILVGAIVFWAGELSDVLETLSLAYG